MLSCTNCTNSFENSLSEVFCRTKLYKKGSRNIYFLLKKVITIDSTAFIPNCSFAIGNAERVMAPKGKFDLVTLYYTFHEIPKSARSRILREARRLLKSGGKLAVIDICPREYVPVPSMLAGEPYVLEYQQNIEEQMNKFQGFHDLEMKNIVPGHVTMWLTTRN